MIAIECPDHKGYKARRKPTSNCPHCRAIWDLVYSLLRERRYRRFWPKFPSD